MNKTYRVIWSDVRGRYVVVGEHARTRGKPHSARSAIATAVAALFIAPAAALAQSVTVSGPLTSPQNYVDQNVTVTSGGSINASTSGGGITAAYVSANPYTSTFSNSGTIAATVGSAYGANAYGLYFDGELAGTLTNSGTISATSNVAFSGYAYGVQIQGNLSGALTNSGTISGSATANGGSAYAYAYGVNVGGTVDGSISNTGSISATANAGGGTGYGYATAWGVLTGTISGTGTFTNSGTISAAATAAVNSGYAQAHAYGVRLNGSLDGSFTNSGTISANATANNGSAYAYAYGAQINSDVNGSFSNSGTIRGTASAGGSGYGMASAWGAQISAISGTGIFTNSGTISGIANATANSGYAYAYGVQINGNVDGSFTNSGTISASANAVGTAGATGVRISGTMSGTFTNSGTITATANGATGGYAYGVNISNLSGVVNNSGTISGVGSGGVSDSNVYSLYAGGGGTVNNLAGGVLDGQVFVGGDLNNAGIIDTRMNVSQVGGNYTQASTGKLTVGATDNATHGALNVSGTANLASGATFAVNGAAGNTLAAGTMSSVLTSGGLTMPSATVTDNVLSLNYTAVGNGNNVDLVATTTGLTTVAAATSGGTGSSVGSALDYLLANIGSQPQLLQDYLYSLGSQTTPQGVADEVQKILPLINTGATQVSFDTSQGVNNVVLARLDSGLGRSAGDKFYGNRMVWLKPFGSWANQDDRNGVTGYDARTAGIVAGVDADVGANRLGVAFGYARSNVDGNSSIAPQNAKIDSYQLVFYGDRRLSNATDVNFRAGIGLHDNNGRRTINVPGVSVVATSDYRSWSGNLGAGIAHNIKWSERTTFTPSLRADYTWIHNKGYIESGAGALGLTVNPYDVGKFVVGADGKFTHTVSDTSKFIANVGLGYDLINQRATVTSALAGAPTVAFSTQGIKPSAWLLRGGLGMSFRTGQGAEVTARYDLDARTGFTNQTASVKVRWAF